MTKDSSGLLNSLMTGSSIKYKTDSNPITLCYSELTPVTFLGSNQVCCQESFLYITGIDNSFTTLSLPAPSTGWTTAGSVCMYLMVFSNSTVPVVQPLFSYGSFSISMTYNPPYNLLFGIKNSATSIFSQAVAYTSSTWISVCFTFQIQGGNHLFTIMESLGPNVYTQLFAIQTFTLSSTVNIYTQSNVVMAVKNLLLMNRAINQTEHLLMYWANPYNTLHI